PRLEKHLEAVEIISGTLIGTGLSVQAHSASEHKDK
ncbi:hypothetical protein DBR06_SOUSAS1210057, partial [Sousa chinensis]